VGCSSDSCGRLRTLNVDYRVPWCFR